MVQGIQSSSQRWHAATKQLKQNRVITVSMSHAYSVHAYVNAGMF